MLCLLDTNILLRTAQPNHPMYRDAVDTVDAFILRGDSPAIVPQVIVEFWTVCTRPVANNGLGLTPAQAEAEATRVESVFKVLPENARIFEIWKQLVVRYAVSGLAAHDARIVAAMLTHGVTHILTFNADDFRRFTDVAVLTPTKIVK